MSHLLAIICFILALIFYQWNMGHDTWTYVSWMLLGFIMWCLSGHEKMRWLP